MGYYWRCVNNYKPHQDIIVMGLQYKEQYRQQCHYDEQTIKLPDAYLVVVAVAPEVDGSCYQQQYCKAKGEDLWQRQLAEVAQRSKHQ